MPGSLRQGHQEHAAWFNAVALVRLLDAGWQVTAAFFDRGKDAR